MDSFDALILTTFLKNPLCAIPLRKTRTKFAEKNWFEKLGNLLKAEEWKKVVMHCKKVLNLSNKCCFVKKVLTCLQDAKKIFPTLHGLSHPLALQVSSEEEGRRRWSLST